MNLTGGHFLKEDIAAFDARFFSISPAEAKSMDPMQRILLEVVYEAMENAGISLSQLDGSDTSCYVGCFTDDYDGLLKRDMELSPKYHSVAIVRQSSQTASASASISRARACQLILPAAAV